MIWARFLGCQTLFVRFNVQRRGPVGLEIPWDEVMLAIVPPSVDLDLNLQLENSCCRACIFESNLWALFGLLMFLFFSQSFLFLELLSVDVLSRGPGESARANLVMVMPGQ